MIENENGKLARRAKFFASGILAAILAGALAACGGGGSDGCIRLDGSRNSALPRCAAPSSGNPDGGTTIPSTGQGPVAATAQLLVSSQQLNSDGAAPVDLTLVARDANGQAIGNRQVQLLVADPANTAYISNFSQTTGTTHSTDANGKLTATLNLGGSKANRTIGLTAKVDEATVSNSVNVVGTTLTVSGSNAVGFGAETQLRLLVTDSASKPIPDTQVSVTSPNGNPVVLASQTTDSNGKATVTVTGAKAGLDKIAASAAGASASYSVNVSSHNFNFTAPVPDSNNNINKNIDTDVTITVRWTNNGAPVASQPVNFATTRGAFTTGQATVSATTNPSGEVSVTLKSASTGPATITASNPTSGGLAASVDVNFVSPKLASKLALQANKTTVAINPPGTDANVVTLTAVARDEDNNPVANAVVNFHIEQDPTGGSLFPASATTDAFGVARSQYVPTSQSSPTNGVIVSASAAAGAVKSPNLALTVGGQQLFVRIGTDNIVGTVKPLIRTCLIRLTTSSNTPLSSPTQQVIQCPTRPFSSWSVRATIRTTRSSLPISREDMSGMACSGYHGVGIWLPAPWDA